MMNLTEWKKLRQKVLERDNHTCQICLKPEYEFDIGLSVHHLIRKEKYNGLDSIHNLTSVCNLCHEIIEITKPPYIKSNKEKRYRFVRWWVESK